MDISVTQFRVHCLELIRRVESGGDVVEITRHGRPVTRLTPPAGASSEQQRPWQKMQGSGALEVEPKESVLDARGFDALQ